MNTATYDLTELYKLAFGYSRPPYPALLLESGALGISPVGTFKALKGAFNRMSILGNEYIMPVEIDGFQFPLEPSISIDGSKNVIETPLNRSSDPQHRNVQNVLEEVNQNNYQIELRGLIINETDHDEYPEEQVRRIIEICEKPGSVEIRTALTSLVNVDQIQIIRHRLFEVRGNVSVQAFLIQALSDRQIELELTGPETP